VYKQFPHVPKPSTISIIAPSDGDAGNVTIADPMLALRVSGKFQIYLLLAVAVHDCELITVQLALVRPEFY